MIHEVSGDILFSSATVIAHGVAPNDNFHAGLALALRERLPAMYKDFRHFCQTRHPKSGELWTWVCADTRRIVSLFTKDAAYGQGAKPGLATLENVNHSLRALHALTIKENFSSLALPRISCGQGELNWKDVQPLMEKHLGSLTVPVYVYTDYHKGIKAIEPKAKEKNVR